MKEIKAIIDHGRLSKVLSALHELPHFPGVTISNAEGQGRGRGPGGRYEPHAISWRFSKKVKLEVFCSDAIADEIVKTIADSAREGEAAHGIILVSDIERAIRVRTGQQQDEAL